MDLVTILGLGLLVALALLGVYVLFKDSANLWQSIWPLYWVTRTEQDVSFRVRRARAQSGGDPYSEGRGIEFRLPQRWWPGRTFQFGIVTKRNARRIWFGSANIVREWTAPANEADSEENY